MSTPVLHVEHVTMQFGGVVAVNDLSMDVYDREIVALIGPNGAGKTTAFNCITGVYEPTNGRVDFLGEPIVCNHPHGKMKKIYAGEGAERYLDQRVVSYTPDVITKRGIARTFQNIRLFKSMTVFENVLTAMHVRRTSNVFSATFRTNHKEEAAQREKALELGIELPQDVVDYISENITNNVRQIEGTVKKIKAYHDLTGMPLDITNVSRAIKDMYKGKTQAIPTPDLIISEVCRFYSIDESTLRSTLKNKGTAEARQVAMYLIRKLTNLSLPDIAKEFGKNHTTVLYALKKVEQELPNSSNGLQDNIRDITSNINSRL